MSKPSEIREEALRMRNLGQSYSEILHEIPVSKSTLSAWLSGIRLHGSPRHLRGGRAYLARAASRREVKLE